MTGELVRVEETTQDKRSIDKFAESSPADFDRPSRHGFVLLHRPSAQQGRATVPAYMISSLEG